MQRLSRTQVQLGIRSSIAQWRTAPLIAAFLLSALPPLAEGSRKPAAPVASQGQAAAKKYKPDPSTLLRIWMVDIGQGDGMVVQFPRGPRAKLGKDGLLTGGSEVEMVIDGGAEPRSDARRFIAFLEALYPEGAEFEYGVISHHDADHVEGIIRLLEDPRFSIQNLLHNGLASYAPGHRGFPIEGPVPNAVVTLREGKVARGMGFLEPGTDQLQEKYLINNLQDLVAGRKAKDFQGVYERLADAVAKESSPAKVKTFPRAKRGDQLIKPVSGVQIETLWPKPEATKYRQWSETINGNSVVLKLEYGAFSMLFTGDMNEHSEEDFLASWGDQAAAKLRCSVLKVPHHGSDHALEEFFLATGKSDKEPPPFSVASMGRKGFSESNWKHPSTRVIGWLGGFDRVFYTLLQEQEFSWKELQTKKNHEDFIEESHLLIETDGKMMRLVEIDGLHYPLEVPVGPPDNTTGWMELQ